MILDWIGRFAVDAPHVRSSGNSLRKGQVCQCTSSFDFFKDISGVRFGSLVTNYDQIWRYLRLWLTIGPKANLWKDTAFLPGSGLRFLRWRSRTPWCRCRWPSPAPSWWCSSLRSPPPRSPARKAEGCKNNHSLGRQQSDALLGQSRYFDLAFEPLIWLASTQPVRDVLLYKLL